MTVKTFNISFPQDLADQIDQVAAAEFGSRSDFLRMAAQKFLRDREQLQGLINYGQTTVSPTSKYQTPEAVANYFTNRRREQEVWRSNSS